MAAADWPDHSNKEWRITLGQAYELGWPKPHKTSNHPKLILKCPKGDPSCTVIIFGTGEGTETVAIGSRRKIARCPHRDVAAPLAKADRELDTADRLITGAETLVRRGDAAAKIHELLDLAGTAVDDASASIEADFDATDAEYAALTEEAERLLEADADSAAVIDAADSAHPHLREARVIITPLPPRSPEVNARQDRLDALVARRDILLEGRA